MFIKACILDDHPCTDTRNHTAMSFVNSDWPYIPLLEGSHRALLPVGLHYKLLALGLSLSLLSSILRRVFVDFTTPWAVPL
jgi:hypothetical protein